MRHTSFRKILPLAACLLVPRLALSQVPRQSGTLSVNGYPGQVPVIQVNGRSYVEIESLARLTSGSMSFRGKQIILTFPTSAEHIAAPDSLDKDLLDQQILGCAHGLSSFAVSGQF